MNFSRLAERLRSRMPLLDNDPEASRDEDLIRKVLEIIAEEIENEVQRLRMSESAKATTFLDDTTVEVEILSKSPTAQLCKCRVIETGKEIVRHRRQLKPINEAGKILLEVA